MKFAGVLAIWLGSVSLKVFAQIRKTPTGFQLITSPHNPPDSHSPLLYVDANLWGNTFTEYIRPCNRSDPHLNVCVANSIAHLRNHLLVGIKDLEVPSIDPLRITKIQMENGVGRVRVKAVFSDLTVYGPANHTLTNIRANVEDYTMEIAAKAPRLIITGRYEVFGNILVVNIRSRGEFQAVFEDVAGIAKLQGKEVTLNEVRYMKIDKVGIDFKVGRARFRVRDRSTNSKVLGEAINNFLNQNWREVIEEMKYTASAAMGKYLKQTVNAALLKVPMNLWLIED